MERITRFRSLALTVIFLTILTIFSARMYSMQVLGKGHVVDNSSSFTVNIRVRAARGEILDTNGNLLVGNRASYNMVFNNYVLMSSSNPNESLRKLVDLCRELGIDYEENFPITTARPYEYTLEEYDSTWQGYFQSYLSEMDIDSDISANRLMEELIRRYKIPEDWSDADKRRVIGLRYELALRTGVTNLPSYEFIVDVSDQTMTALLELNTPGLTAEVSTVREYYTDYAAHILGTVGKINAEDWPEYKEKGYAMDAFVGTSGLEQAFEEYLRGTDGTLRRTVDKEGNIISEYYVTEPKAGNNVEISIDMDMQIAAEQRLAEVIQELNANQGLNGNGKGADASAGAVVAIDIATGKILVCGSYPTFNLSTYRQDFATLNEDKTRPLYNRALQGTYAPGSTFKLCMTIAGIDSGAITMYTPITDQGVYTKYDGFRPTCMIYGNTGNTHGSIDVTDALKVSCNYFFYELGDRLSITTIDNTAKGLGLGEPTGVELPEKTGSRANPQTKIDLYGEEEGKWYPGNKVLASIGQDENRYTPLQLAVYTATIANKGTRYAATFLNRVVSADYSSLVLENQARVMSTMAISDEAYEAVKTGMLKVTSESYGSAVSYFREWGSDIQVCGKTGTAEHGSGGSNHGSFVCFAPADDPQIAIAVYGERAGQGGNLSRVAQAIMDVYFSRDVASDVTTSENRVS